MWDMGMSRRHRQVAQRAIPAPSSEAAPQTPKPHEHAAAPKSSAQRPAKTPPHTQRSSPTKPTTSKKASRPPSSHAHGATPRTTHRSSASSSHSSSKHASSTTQSVAAASTIRHLGSAASTQGAPASTAGTAPMVNASNDGSSLSGGAIAGIAIGAFVGLALIALLAYLLSRWKPSGRTEQGVATTPTTQAPATEPPVTEPTTHAAQDATYDMAPAPALPPTYYTTDTLAPYLEQEPHTAHMAQEAPPSWQMPYNPIASRAPATDTALASTDAAAWPEDQSTYDQNTLASAPPLPQHLYTSPTSRDSTDKLDAYADAWPSRRTYHARSRSQRNAAAEAADAALQDGSAYHPTSDWDDSASELPYIRTSRRRGAVDA